MDKETPRDGFTAREMFLMRQAFNAGISEGMTRQMPGSVDSWLDDPISDGGHYVAQMLSYDADRLYFGNDFASSVPEDEEQRLIFEIQKLQRRNKIDMQPYLDRLIEIEQNKPPRPIVFSIHEIEEMKANGDVFIKDMCKQN